MLRLRAQIRARGYNGAQLRFRWDAVDCYLCESCQKASSELGWQDEYGFGDLRERSLEIEMEALHADDHD